MSKPHFCKHLFTLEPDTNLHDADKKLRRLCWRNLTKENIITADVVGMELSGGPGYERNKEN